MTDQPQPVTPRLITITDEGKIKIVGKWKVRELLAAAQMVANLANEIEVEQQPDALQFPQG